MPEMPEVQGLVGFLRERATGLRITRATIANIAALKTYDPPLDTLKDATVTGAFRRGKFVDLSTDGGPHLVFHLAKAGWLRWYEQLPTTVIRPGKTPIALRIAFDDGSGFDLTEAGTKKSLATGVPMASVIFAGQSIGAIVLPLMLFHQMQLMVCAVLAARYARRAEGRGALAAAATK